MVRYKNSNDALIYALQFASAKAASAWINRKIRIMKDCDFSEWKETGDIRFAKKLMAPQSSGPSPSYKHII